MFQYPLVGRGGSNGLALAAVFRYCAVSVPSGGSWWEQPRCGTRSLVAPSVSVPSGGSWWEQPKVGCPPTAPHYVSVPSGGSWWEQPYSRLSIHAVSMSFSTLWWVVVGATVRGWRTQRLLLRFQYPLVGRGGSNSAGGFDTAAGTKVSVPSGGSWWEQRLVQRTLSALYQVSVPSGGSWWEQPQEHLEANMTLSRFSTLWWVVVGATTKKIRRIEEK